MLIAPPSTTGRKPDLPSSEDMMKRLLHVFLGLLALLGLHSAAAAQALGQPKVAVYNFKDPNQTGLGMQMRDMISTAVINSGKFQVISRDFASAEEEAQLARAGKTTRGAKGVKPKAESFDFSIEGSITSVQFGEKKDVTGTVLDNILLGGKGVAGGCVAGTFSVSIDVLVKNIGTQETRYAASLTKSLTSECRRTGGAVDYPVVMRAIANDLAREFALKIFPVKVIAIQADGGVVFNYGESVLPAGTYLRLYGPSEEILSDGKMLTMDGPFLGRIRITNANPDTARGAIEGEAGQITVGAVASIDANQEPGKPDKKKKKK